MERRAPFWRLDGRESRLSGTQAATVGSRSGSGKSRFQDLDQETGDAGKMAVYWPAALMPPRVLGGGDRNNDNTLKSNAHFELKSI